MPRYKQTNDRGGGRGGSAFNNASDVEDGKTAADRVSIVSGASGRSKTTSQLEAISKLPWYRGVTCKDVRDIMPTVLILLGGLLIMIFVIPYAFSSVIKQLEAEQVRNPFQELLISPFIVPWGPICLSVLIKADPDLR